MKIRTDIANINGRYNVQVSTFEFTALEEQEMLNFGEPLIETGGNFSGSASRPSQTNTILTVVGTHSILAILTPIILNGVIQSVTVTNPGLGYTADGATIVINGDGSNAVLTPLFGVLAATTYAPGSGYQLNDVVIYGSGIATLQVAITGVDGSGAVTDFAIINSGQFTSVVNSLDGIVMSQGHGTAFALTFVNNWGIVGASAVSGGTGYNTVPTLVNFTLPTATRRMSSDFPVKQVFDLQDSPDSDVMAKVWADTIVASLTSAKNALVSQTSLFEGETVITV